MQTAGERGKPPFRSYKLPYTTLPVPIFSVATVVARSMIPARTPLTVRFTAKTQALSGNLEIKCVLKLSG